MKRLIRAAVCSLHKSKMLTPTTGALVGAVFSGVPGAIAGAGLAGAVAKSFRDDLAAVWKRRLKENYSR
jgi:hypothetical protein